jgi:hypothetical protein
MVVMVVQSVRLSSLQLLCFASFVCFDCARQQERDFIGLLACMPIGWKEWMPIVDTDTKGGGIPYTLPTQV